MYQIQGKGHQLRLSCKWKMHWKEVENLSKNRVWDAWCQVTHALKPQNTVEPPRTREHSFKTINWAGQMGLKGNTFLLIVSSRSSLCSLRSVPAPVSHAYQQGTLYYVFVLWMMTGNRKYQFHNSVSIVVFLLGISLSWLLLFKKKKIKGR